VSVNKPKQKRASIFGALSTDSGDHTSSIVTPSQSFSGLPSPPVPQVANKHAGAPRQKRASTIGAIGAMFTGARDMSEFSVEDSTKLPMDTPESTHSNTQSGGLPRKLSKDYNSVNSSALVALMECSTVDDMSGTASLTSNQTANTANTSTAAVIAASASPPSEPKHSVVTNSEGSARGRSKTVSILAPPSVPSYAAGSNTSTPTNPNNLSASAMSLTSQSSSATNTPLSTPSKRAISFSAETIANAPHTSRRAQHAEADDDNSSVSTTQQHHETASQVSSGSRRPTMSGLLSKGLGLSSSASKLAAADSRTRSLSVNSTTEGSNPFAAGRYDPTEINSFSMPQDSLHAVLRLGIVVLKHGSFDYKTLCVETV
jgi:hypothetical protein